MDLCAQPHGPLTGDIEVPGDKSISHRALLFASLAAGTSRVRGLLEGEDVRASEQALRALGVPIERTADGAVLVHGVGVGGFAEPETVLDLGNAGTGARLLMGLLAGCPFTSFLTGDASLRRRPMGRVAEPLRRMGASIVARSGDRLPLAITGRAVLAPLAWQTPVASAQVKSAILLAALAAPGRTEVIEPMASRDHSERMLKAMGARIESERLGDGRHRVTIVGQEELAPFALEVPGDPSSAAFPLVAAAVTPGSQLTIRSVGLNPLRTGLLETLREMGAEIAVENLHERGGEPVGDLRVRAARLRGVEVPAERAPRMIDEYPILSVAAACAEGRSVMRGLAELRVKESDRLAAIASGLEACGVRAEVEGDDLVVEGCGGPPPGGGAIDARLDHRIAMTFAILGGVARRPVVVRGAETIATSFPGFVELMDRIGAAIAVTGEGS
ncbi:3-phosphoshikimate 1-carboxyvinyltransferase [bacterium HR40]|nr:3-phosphoshikimate 1-carboxyvinyltransferase [bacterium HR40]